MALGQAFVEVHADLTPFRRDLARELKRAADEFERELNRVLGINLQQQAQNSGRQIGMNLGQGASKGLHRELGDKSANIWVSIASALGSALDDGISALPMEVKAALAAGLLAVSPVVVGGLGALVSAGVGLGVAGLGAALATQFESVQMGWRNMISSVRMTLVDAASAFEPVLMRVFDMIDVRIARMAPTLRRLFDVSATFLEPFIGRVLDAINVFIFHIQRVIGDTGFFIDELGDGLVVLADAVGAAFEIIATTGDDGRKALRDLIAIVASLIVGFGILVAVLTKIWGLLRGVAQLFAESPAVIQVLFPWIAGFGHLANAVDGASQSNVAHFHTNVELLDSQGKVITRTKEEIEALKNLATAINAAADAALGAINANVSYERSIDDLQDALKEGGRNIDITTKAGQNTVEAFSRSISDLRQQLLNRMATGELTSAQAVELYNREIERIEALGNAAGITDQKFYELFQLAIDLGALQIAPETAGLDAASASAEVLIAYMREIIALSKHLASVTIGGALAGARATGFADGAIIDRPTFAMMGEGYRPEVVIPLTQPARAAELMRQTGLDQMAGGQTQVLVYIDGQQIEGRMVRVAQRVTAQQGMALAQGFRGL